MTLSPKARQLGDMPALPKPSYVTNAMPGLTIRQYAAVAAMQGLLAANAESDTRSGSDEELAMERRAYGIVAVGFADALLEALAAEEQP